MMKLYQQNLFYCGIDLHANAMYVCVVDAQGKKKSTFTANSCAAAIFPSPMPVADECPHYLTLKAMKMFWRFFASPFVLLLVLSAAVLVIDLSIILRVRHGDTIEFYLIPNVLAASESIAPIELL